MNTVWIKADCTYFEPRCGHCGKYRKEEELRHHWFFNGIYCVTCIVDILYDNCRSLEERP
jgi:hypothetical protein